MASKPYNVGVIGYGMSAKVFHIPLIEVVPDFKLHAVVQRHPKPEDDAEKDHPSIKSYRTTEEMVRDHEVDVVVVTTVPDTHVGLTKLALESGKHGTITTLHKELAMNGTVVPNALKIRHCRRILKFSQPPF